MQQLKISIAICTYNGAKFLEQQLDSILHQTVAPDELVICDDVSSDETVEILKKYQKKYPSIIRYFVNEKNLGYTRNFEKAIGLCTGDIIFLSDQDDVWKPEKIEKYMQIFQTDPAIGLIYSDAEVVDENLKSMGYSIFQSRKPYDLSSLRPVEQIIDNVDIKGCLTAFKASYRSFLLPINDYWAHDNWITLILHAITGIFIINEPLVMYRRHRVNFGKDYFLYPKASTKRLNIESKPEKERRIKGYRLNNNKDKNMCQKLTEIRDYFPKSVTDKAKLDIFIQTYQHLLQSLVPARHRRSKVLESKGVARLIQASRLLLDKTYAQEFQGTSSFFKDILAGWG